MSVPYGRGYWEEIAKEQWTNLGNLPPTPTDPQYDAFRHAYTSALWTKMFGETVARMGGDYIERSNPNNFNRGENGERVMRGDLLNNAKGREIAKDSQGDWSRETLARDIDDSLARDELVTDPSADHRTARENFPTDLNPWNSGGGLPNTWDTEGWSMPDDLERDYSAARSWTRPKDPLVLDLDSDGIEATAIDRNAPILFDHDADGIQAATGWIKADDGIVVLDLNGNGTIDTGRELFGDNTLLPSGEAAANGFEAIAQYDTNADGKINAADAIYTQLRIWQDANQDGVSQANELKTLETLGIASINVVGQASTINLGNGNTQPWSGSYTRTNGTTGDSGTPELSGSLLLSSFV